MTDPAGITDSLAARDLGRLSYASGYAAQEREVDRVLAAREAGRPVVGSLLLLEHDPVITISRRADAASHLLATPAMLQRAGVALAETDRGGDITYHGPGQLVAYPILDLNLLNLGLHDYMRMLEQVVIDALAVFGVTGRRDPGATGVWVDRPSGPAAKVCAMGVRVRKWVSMHGLAMNVTTNLDHFRLIVPCGLQGRPVTSLSQLLGDACPSMDAVKAALLSGFRSRIAEAASKARERRTGGSSGHMPGPGDAIAG